MDSSRGTRGNRMMAQKGIRRSPRTPVRIRRLTLDFDDLRDVVRKAVLGLWDHATLLAADDPLAPAIRAVQHEAPDRVVLLPSQPTAEVLTGEAWARLESQLPVGISLERVAIRET